MKKEKSGNNSEFKQAVIEKVKSLIVPVILCLLIVAAIVYIVTYKEKVEDEKMIEIYEFGGDTTALVMENDFLKFTLDPTTTQFTVEVKENGAVWHSNPVDVSDDTIASSEEKDKLQSVLNLAFSDVKGTTQEHNSFRYSVEKKNYNVEMDQATGSIRVNYSIGDTEREYIIPPACPQAELDEWMDKMDQQSRGYAKDVYKLYDINNLSKKDLEKKDELLADYPKLAETPMYIKRSAATKLQQQLLEEIMADLGYTEEMYKAHKELAAESASSEKPVYNVSIIYTLDGKDLLVKVPMADIEYKKEFPITTLSVLPYFGAGGLKDNGFMLIPEGGGAIIDFNNGKKSQNPYYANLYGWDMDVPRDALVNNTRASFNAFGISQGMNSFVCYMEEGSAYAAVKADISGRLNNYNFVGATYTMCTSQEYKVGELASTRVFVYQEELPDEVITQRYSFVTSGSYVRMAEDYREYLLNRFDGYMKMNDDTSAPVNIEMVGAVDKTKQILGVPVKKPLKLTTFSEAAEIISQLDSEGFKNLTVKMIGWCNGGVNQKWLNKVSPVSELGGKSGLKSMIGNMNTLQVDVYLDGVTQYAYDSDILDGFNSFSDAARFISKERAELFVYSDVTFAAREGVDSYYLLHTSEAERMADNLIKACQGYNVGVAFRDTGMDLSSDFYKKNVVTRQQTLYGQVAKVKAAKDAGTKLSFNNGNDYIIGYADQITNMDLTGSKYAIIDRYVPFYQIAIHGYINYFGKNINNAGDANEAILNAAEYGAGLSFSLMKETAFALQKTLYTEYYGSSYSAWHDRMLEEYTRYNEELGHTFNQKIVNHEDLTSYVTCTTYEDGTKVYVNYGYSAGTTHNGDIVPARDYKVVRY